MKKNTIKLNETQLRKIIAESVKKVLKEGVNPAIVDAMEQFLYATRDLRVLFGREDAAYRTSQEGINWEDMLSNIENEAKRFLDGC